MTLKPLKIFCNYIWYFSIKKNCFKTIWGGSNTFGLSYFKAPIMTKFLNLDCYLFCLLLTFLQHGFLPDLMFWLSRFEFPVLTAIFFKMDKSANVNFCFPCECVHKFEHFVCFCNEQDFCSWLNIVLYICCNTCFYLLEFLSKTI